MTGSTSSQSMACRHDPHRLTIINFDTIFPKKKIFVEEKVDKPSSSFLTSFVMKTIYVCLGFGLGFYFAK